MSDLTPAAHELLSRQHGAVSTDDLVECGLNRSAIRDIVRRGGLELVVAGAYRSPSVPDSELQRCAALCRARPDLVIAGPTAGRLYGFRRLPADDRVHAIAPPHSHPTQARWVRVFRTPTIVDADIVERDDGIRLLNRPRLALDLGRFVAGLDHRSIIEQAMHDGHHTVAEMRDAAVDWQSPRRRWVRKYLEALALRVPGPPAESHLELLVGNRLRACGINDLVAQHCVDLPGYGTARFDFAVPSLMWAIEVDGFPTHRETAGALRDGRRDAAARSAGWTVRRLGPNDLGDRLEHSVSTLVAEYIDLAA